MCKADVASPAVEEGGACETSVKGKFNEMLQALGGVDLVIYSSGMGKQNAAFDMNVEYAHKHTRRRYNKDSAIAQNLNGGSAILCGNA